MIKLYTDKKLCLKNYLLAAFLALAAGCGSSDQQPVKTDSQAETSVKVSWPQENWERSTLTAEGFDADIIDGFVKDLREEKYGLVDHFLLIKHGRIVIDERFERDYDAVVAALDPKDLISPNATYPRYDYDNTEWHPYYKGTDLHTLQSVTKSVTSAAIGIAIDKEFITGTDVAVLPYFSSYEFDKSDPRKAKITLDHLLTMRSGIGWVTEAGYTAETHTTIELENSENWIQFILDRPMDQEPGAIYEYNDGASVLLGKILRVATNKRIDEWAQEQLFSPIGIKNFHWKITPDGEADTEGGLYLSAHDLARFGYLFLRNGIWDGKQIISSEWVQKSATPFTADVSKDEPRRQDFGYGYQWWIPEHENGRPIVFSGRGFGGQYVLVFPKYDVVAIFQGWDPRNSKSEAESVFRTFVLPASLGD